MPLQSFSKLLHQLNHFITPEHPACSLAKADARTFLDYINGFKELPNLLLGANALPVNPVTCRAYLQQHRRSRKMWPCGGEVAAEDRDDVITTARRELLEEAPQFRTQNHRPLLSVMADYPVIDVHIKESIIQEKPGTWVFLTVGFWTPPDFTAENPAVKSYWVPLMDCKTSEDTSLKRAAGTVLAILKRLDRAC